ncbi:MAG TPA: NAD-binding protein [Chitinophagales bacterium]|nr:NAD-binding protein [Chitinophagales bacterium]
MLNQQPTLGQRIRYKFENTLSKGTPAMIMWLGIVSLILVLICGIIILALSIKDSPDSESSLGFIEGTWKSLMATLDPGTMGGDEGWAFRIIRFIATLGGIFIISILIGAIGSGIESKLDELRKGKSKVLESNHTLILGWSPKVFSIIEQLVIANENQKKPRIVVMADMDKVEMEDEVRSKIADTKNTKVICRSGSPLDLYDLEVVSPHDARSIIILSPENNENADTYIIKSVLAITNNPNRKKDKYHVIAEITDPENMEAAEMVGGDEAVFVISGDLISRVTAQTCRQSGLSTVYTEILQFEGDEIYFTEEKSLIGKTFKEALFAYETTSVIGILTAEKNILLNPSMDTVINSGDQIVGISEDDDTLIVSNKKEYNINESIISNGIDTHLKKERTLILGWNQKGMRIVEELDNYVGENSEVLIVSVNEQAHTHVEELKKNISKQHITLKKGLITDRKTLEDLQCENFDHIIILSTRPENIQENDARTLICLLHLRNLSEKAGKDFSIVSEMLDVRNRALAEVAKADDFIISDNLISLMLTQIAENKHLKKVYDILFEADGSEIYLKPALNYVLPDTKTNFYTILESAARKNEVAIGYRIVGDERDASKHYGVKINPKKDEEFILTANDKVIVLAEDY